MNDSKQYYMVDIDGTLTDYRGGVLAPEKLLHSNFLFPIIRDLMTEHGWDKSAAEKAIFESAERIVFWDYSDFLAEFGLPTKEALYRMRRWHMENMVVYHDTVRLVKELARDGKQLFIMSNNPYMGCMFKLQVAGLAENDFSSPYFRRIFGTNILHGCKCNPDVWRRAFAQIPADISEIGVIGDNPEEDDALPRSLGVKETYIILQTTISRGIDGKETNKK